MSASSSLTAFFGYALSKRCAEVFLLTEIVMLISVGLGIFIIWNG